VWLVRQGRAVTRRIPAEAARSQAAGKIVEIGRGIHPGQIRIETDFIEDRSLRRIKALRVYDA
jgi:hypothetical protein